MFLGTAGEVGGRVDRDALEDVGILGHELLNGAQVLLEDGG